MGVRALQQPALAQSAVAGAVLSTIATILQMAVVLAATRRSTLNQMRFPLIAAGVAAPACGALLMACSVSEDAPPSAQKGRAFSLKTAAFFASMIAAMLFLSAALNALLARRECWRPLRLRVRRHTCSRSIGGFAGGGQPVHGAKPCYRFSPGLRPTPSAR
jgi:hypothetical protein